MYDIVINTSKRPRFRGDRGRSRTRRFDKPTAGKFDKLTAGRSDSAPSGRRSGGGPYRSRGGRPGRHQHGSGPRRGRFQGKPISHDKFINRSAAGRVEAPYVPTHRFSDFGFDARIVENLTKRGYTTPTRIQDEAMSHILAGKDLVGLANTGSGKTAAFILPIIQKLIAEPARGSVLIITPTRELATQIEKEFRQFAEGMQRYAVVCVGGLNIRAQKRELRRGPHVIIGTPGRLKDLINQRELRLEQASTLVLDEADRMLDMGFLPDIRFIIGKLSAKRQSLCFGATMPPQIAQLIEQMLVSPVTVSVRTSETGEHIAQDIIRAGTREEKLRELTKMLAQDHFEKVLVFGQMKHSVQKLADTLTRMGFPAVAIHGNKSQPQRQRALDAFKQGKVNILVATDVAARGLDIPNVSHVINFDQPNTHEEYVHRIGRTGRAGKPGQAYTFVS